MTSKKFIVEFKKGHKFVVEEDTWNGMVVGDRVNLIEKIVEQEEMVAMAATREDPQNKFFWLMGNLVGDGNICGQFINLYYDFHPAGNTKELARGMAEYAKQCISDLRLGRATGSIVQPKNENRFRVETRGQGMYSKISEYLADGKVVKYNIENSPLVCQAQFLRGLFDADAHVKWVEEDHHGYPSRLVVLVQSNYDLLRTVLRMLLNFGIVSHIHFIHGTQLNKFPDGQKHMCKASYHLTVSREQNLQRFHDFIGFREPEKSTKLGFIVGKKFVSNQEVKFTDVIFCKSVVDDVDDMTVAKFEDFAYTLNHTYVKKHNHNTRKRRANNTGQKEDRYCYIGKDCHKRSRCGF